MAKIHDLFIIELAEVIKGYGNDPDVEDPFRLSEFYRFYELPNIAVSRENFEKMRPAQQEQRWIPCNERLPKEEKKTYWVCTDTGHQCECRWTNNRFGIGEGEWGWSIFDTPQYSKPIAWMPLPEPYREERTEE